MYKKIFLTAVVALGSAMGSFAQSSDPVIMTINGQPVYRSEFEYSYTKNNSEGVIDKKTVKEYVDLFVNYKLKVQAALDEKMDTLTSFNKEYREYRDQQIRPTLITDADVEKEAQNIYRNTRERVGDVLYSTSHILIRLEQNADEATKKAAQQRADSIYNALKGGADFKELATRLSEDPGSARQGGSIGQIGKGQVVPEYENAAFALNEGEISAPVLSNFGYHIIKMDGKKEFEPYEALREDIMRFIDARGIREAIINNRINELIASGISTEKLMDQRADSLAAADMEMKYLFNEYHDGLLLYEISNREVWERASKDEKGLAAFYKKNKKNYKWDEPHFKGIAYHCRNQEDVDAVKKVLKGKKFDKWADILRSTFNNDSILRLRAEKGVFAKGDNALVDKEQYGLDKKPTALKDYPYDGTYGSIIKAPQQLDDVRGQVVADYQDALEKAWVAQLRKRYTVIVNDDIVATIKEQQ